MCHSFYKLLLVIFTGSLLRTSWIKTRCAQKLLVRVKFTGNPYPDVCKWPTLQYTKSRVCRKSYMGTCTVPDSYLCLCEHSLRQADATLDSFLGPFAKKCRLVTSWCVKLSSIRFYGAGLNTFNLVPVNGTKNRYQQMAPESWPVCHHY